MTEFYVEGIETELPTSVVDMVNDEAVATGLVTLLNNIFRACRVIGNNLRCCNYSAEAVGTVNEFGDNQLDVDVKSDQLLFDYLRNSSVVAIASSEEEPHEIQCGGVGYSVAFDPLDGSSIVDANFAVGTILGVWPGSTLFNRTGREQSCSVVVQYGPRVTAALALSGSVTVNGQPISMELTMHSTAWWVSIPKISIAAKANTFAPGNLRATADNAQYKKLVDYWISNQYTLRYSGGLVPDVYHMLIKGQGVMSNASSKSTKAKLRLLYECAPIALIVESAGGLSCVCASEEGESLQPISMLDVPIDHLDRRVGVCFGSSNEVARFISHIYSQVPDKFDEAAAAALVVQQC
jgi:sedoheptulose-bisphosphatase